MSRRAWIAFGILQVLGAGCYWMWAHVYSVLGVGMWVGSYVFLLPGNILVGWPISKLLWGSALTLLQLQIVQVLSGVSANAGVWLSAAALWRRRQRVRALPHARTDL